MTVPEQLMKIIRASLTAVSPELLTKNAISRNGNKLEIGGETYHLNKNVIVVGFGKAVAGIARGLEDVIGEHIKGGVLSVPRGLTETMIRTNKRHMLPKDTEKIKLFEGGKNNLPDDTVVSTTQKIMDIVKTSKPDDVVVALISGGGSSLLTCPIEPLTLNDMRNITLYFANKGATIQELNVVRSAFSQVKGGKLAIMSHPTTVVGIILSDIIGNPLEYIASGPTTVQRENNSEIFNSIISKFEARNDKIIGPLIKYADLKTKSSDQDLCVNNLIIGSNEFALKAAEVRAKELGFKPLILSDKIQGEARNVGLFYGEILKCILLKKAQQEKVLPLLFTITSSDINSFQSLLLQSLSEKLSMEESKRICVIAGGEPTVNVVGAGIGGRNLEVALGFAMSRYENKIPLNFTWVFSSIGTDGQDGPTPAAGAFVSNEMPITQDLTTTEKVKKSLAKNDSYNYLKSHAEGNLIITGPTCTNVMDLHILLVDLS